MVTDVRSAELTQCAANATLATKISSHERDGETFGNPALPVIKSALFDGRNIYNPAAVDAAGLAYYGIGRGRSIATVGSRTS